ncbi:hypothetical protein NPIL_319541 [Nephila pilipes]|uniref:Uncharacterized protein n=1 Tax=Nephila pilipes TaxID=299642 RepID=A0A8X6TZU7_NEPPI|nr:hypothetical protein NPIL_319541 [Nephila pilipes]
MYGFRDINGIPVKTVFPLPIMSIQSSVRFDNAHFPLAQLMEIPCCSSIVNDVLPDTHRKLLFLHHALNVTISSLTEQTG